MVFARYPPGLEAHDCSGRCLNATDDLLDNIGTIRNSLEESQRAWKETAHSSLLASFCGKPHFLPLGRSSFSCKDSVSLQFLRRSMEQNPHYLQTLCGGYIADNALGTPLASRFPLASDLELLNYISWEIRIRYIHFSSLRPRYHPIKWLQLRCTEYLESQMMFSRSMLRTIQASSRNRCLVVKFFRRTASDPSISEQPINIWPA